MEVSVWERGRGYGEGVGGWKWVLKSLSSEIGANRFMSMVEKSKKRADRKRYALNAVSLFWRNHDTDLAESPVES